MNLISVLKKVVCKIKLSNRLVRTIVLTVFVAITLNWSIQHLAGIGNYLCNYCPGGALAASVLLLSGENVAKINVGNIVALLALTVTTLALGRGFCGWICPFGAIFEYLNIIGNKLNIVREPSVKIDRFLKYLKYFIFVGLIIVTTGLGEYIFMDFCPARALYILKIPGNGAILSLTILATVLAGGVVIPRFFCRYLCPLGAYTAVVAKISPMSLKLDKDACIYCGKCAKSCQLGIDPTKDIQKMECTNCLDCVDICPTDALEVKL